MYYTYVLYSETYDRLYVGQTDDLVLRLQNHNEGRVKSTKHYIPWEIIYFEEFDTRSEAMIREKQLKTHDAKRIIRENYISR